jgi:hypothetical protein
VVAFGDIFCSVVEVPGMNPERGSCPLRSSKKDVAEGDHHRSKF